MWFVIILCVIFIYFIIFPKTKPIWLYCILCIGIGTMFIANILYAMKMSNLSNDVLFHLFINIQYSSMFTKIGIDTLRTISICGEVLILSYFVLFALTMYKGNRYKFLIMLIPLALYIYLNLPDTMFLIAIKLKSVKSSTAKIEFNIIYYTIQAIITICFLLPYLFLLKRYRNTGFTLIKKTLIIQTIFIAYIEIAIIAFAYFKIIHNFFIPSENILYNKNIPEKYDLMALLIIITLIVTIFTLCMVFKSKIFQSQIKIKKKSIFKNNKKFDKNLRMILHTYKNMFFSFRQLSSYVLDNEQKLIPQNQEAIKQINQISTSALYTITKQLEMLKDFEITTKKLNVIESINIAKEKILMQKKTDISLKCHTDNLYLTADEFYLTDMFYTLLTNSAEAVIDVDNPVIAIDIFYEDNWFLFEIYDNGTGIEKYMRRKIFKPLVSEKGGANNWGIGLYYVSKIISAHNGYIFLESEPSQYTKFQIYIPKLSN